MRCSEEGAGGSGDDSCSGAGCGRFSVSGLNPFVGAVGREIPRAVIYREDIPRPAATADSRLCIVVGRVPRFHTPLRVHIGIATAVPKVLEAARLGRRNAVEATAKLRAVMPIVRPPANKQASVGGHESSARTRVPHQHVSSVLHVCVPSPPPPTRAPAHRLPHTLTATQNGSQHWVAPPAPHPALTSTRPAPSATTYLHEPGSLASGSYCCLHWRHTLRSIRGAAAAAAAVAASAALRPPTGDNGATRTPCSCGRPASDGRVVSNGGRKPTAGVGRKPRGGADAGGFTTARAPEVPAAAWRGAMVTRQGGGEQGSKRWGKREKGAPERRATPRRPQRGKEHDKV